MFLMTRWELLLRRQTVKARDFLFYRHVIFIKPDVLIHIDALESEQSVF